MKRPSEMGDTELGLALHLLNESIELDEDAPDGGWTAYAKAVRELFLGEDIAELRAEVTRTAAVVQALAAVIELPASDAYLVQESLRVAIGRLIDLRAQQAKLDPVLGEVAK